MQKITPCLWFDMNCEEAINFYVSVFPNSSIKQMQKYPEGMTEGPMQGMAGRILTGIFELDGLTFQALDGGPYFKVTPAISFMVNFDPSKNPHAAADLDALWAKLSEGGLVRMPKQEYPFSKMFGWIQDRFGVNWQLILTDPDGEPRPNIIPALLFTKDVSGKAEEAGQFYTSLFTNSRIGMVAKYPPGMPGGVDGGVMFEDIMLDGQWFALMDGGPEHDFKFNEAVSLSVETADQEETDFFFKSMSAVPESEQCGWLKDKYGVSWQIAPKRMGELLSSSDTEKAKKAMSAMLKMKKINIAELEVAYNA
ncbi:MAG: VOC family protein [Candidatus Pacebacteria bacterium]|nr:VOC family protein [Candidatus Paceibacterota bacterium]